MVNSTQKNSSEAAVGFSCDHAVAPYVTVANALQKAPRRAPPDYKTMLISGGGGGKSLPAVGAPTLTLLLATAAETHWKNLAKALASMVSSEATVSVSCRR